MPLWGFLIIIAAAVVGVLILFYFLGKRTEKKQAQQEAQIEQNKQNMPMLVIDKKMLRLKDSGLPDYVIAQTPKMLRRSKMPIVKAKVGPKIMIFVTTKEIFEAMPLKKEIRATVSGLYIVGIKGIRGSIVNPKKQKKENFFQKLLKKGRGEI